LLEALSVNVPVPFLVTVPPLPVLMPVVLTVVSPVPLKVRAKPVPVMPPLRVKVPPFELICEAEPSVIAPLQVLLLAKLIKAPPLLIPVPLRLVMASAIFSPEPSI